MSETRWVHAEGTHTQGDWTIRENPETSSWLNRWEISYQGSYLLGLESLEEAKGYAEGMENAKRAHEAQETISEPQGSDADTGKGQPVEEPQSEESSAGWTHDGDVRWSHWAGFRAVREERSWYLYSTEPQTTFLEEFFSLSGAMAHVSGILDQRRMERSGKKDIRRADLIKSMVPAKVVEIYVDDYVRDKDYVESLKEKHTRWNTLSDAEKRAVAEESFWRRCSLHVNHP